MGGGGSWGYSLVSQLEQPIWGGGGSWGYSLVSQLEQPIWGEAVRGAIV